MSGEVIYGIATGIHSLAAFFWVGSLLFLTLVLIPKSKTLGAEGKKFMDEVFDKLTPLVIVSIVLLAVFGIVSRKLRGLTGELTPSFKIIHTVKIVLTGIMVIIAVVRQLMRKKMKKMKSASVPVSEKPKGKNVYALVYLNALIGSIVVILSGFMAITG